MEFVFVAHRRANLPTGSRPQEHPETVDVFGIDHSNYAPGAMGSNLAKGGMITVLAEKRSEPGLENGGNPV